MIESLTDEQMTKFPEYVQKWIDIETSTDMDRDDAEAAINLSYICAGLTPPNEIIWFKGPKTMIEYVGDHCDNMPTVWDSFAYVVRESVINPYNEVVIKNVNRPVLTTLQRSIRRGVGRPRISGTVWSSVWKLLWTTIYVSDMDACIFGHHGLSINGPVSSSFLFGHNDVSDMATYDYFRNELNLIEKIEPLQGLMDLAKSCGWIIPSKERCVASDKPIVCELDHTNVIHNESGPAIAYADGLEIYAFHGTVVPKSWIVDTPDVKEVLTESNVEVRAAGMEILGWVNLLDHLGAKLIDKDDDPLIGALYSVKLPDLEGRHLIVKYTCPRNGVMGQPVPDENHLNGEKITTILGAKAWLAESTLSEYMPPEIRT